MQDAADDAVVGSPLVATQAGLDVAVLFYMLTPSSLFKVGMCNGQVRLIAAGACALNDTFVCIRMYVPVGLFCCL